MSIFQPPGLAQPKPAGSNNPVAEFWGIGQTERWPSTYPNEDGGRNRRMRFAARTGGQPHRHFFGGADAIGDPFVAVGDISGDIDATPNVAPALDGDTVFSLNAGIYTISGWLGVRASLQVTIQYALFRIRANADDLIISNPAAYTQVANDPLEHVYPAASFNAAYLEVASDDQFYIMMTEAHHTIDARQFMLIERLQ